MPKCPSPFYLPSLSLLQVPYDLQGEGPQLTEPRDDESAIDLRHDDPTTMHWYVYSVAANATLSINTPTFSLTLSPSVAQQVSFNFNDIKDMLVSKQYLLLLLHDANLFGLCVYISLVFKIHQFVQHKFWGSHHPAGSVFLSAMHATRNVQFTMYGYSVESESDILATSVPATFLIGYRTPVLSWDLHPEDPTLYHTVISSCSDASDVVQINIRTKGAGKSLRMNATFPVNSFTSRVSVSRLGFQKRSFVSMCGELVVQAYQGLGEGTLIGEERLFGAMLDISHGYLQSCIGQHKLKTVGNSNEMNTESATPTTTPTTTATITASQSILPTRSPSNSNNLVSQAWNTADEHSTPVELPSMSTSASWLPNDLSSISCSTSASSASTPSSPTPTPTPTRVFHPVVTLTIESRTGISQTDERNQEGREPNVNGFKYPEISKVERLWIFSPQLKYLAVAVALIIPAVVFAVTRRLFTSDYHEEHVPLIAAHRFGLESNY
jgi:hypothetical protein